MTRTVIIAQARMSSTRLPGKSMRDLGGRLVVDRVFERARRSRLADDVWVATTTDPTDDVLAEHLDRAGIPYVRGSLDDVLARYVATAEAARADEVVRITCDCPLIDPACIDEVIAGRRAEPEVDYCSNTLERTYPIGMDAEAFTRASLERAAREATRTVEREHVTPYLYQHPDVFRLRSVTAPSELAWPDLRLTVDEARDVEMLDTLLQRVGSDADLGAILAAIRAEPWIAAINQDVQHRHVDKPTSW